ITFFLTKIEILSHIINLKRFERWVFETPICSASQLRLKYLFSIFKEIKLSAVSICEFPIKNTVFFIKLFFKLSTNHEIDRINSVTFSHDSIVVMIILL